MSRSESLSVPAKLVQTSRFLNCRALYTRIGRPARKISFWYTIKSLFSLSRPSLLAGVAGLLKHAPLSVGSSPEGDFLRENSIFCSKTSTPSCVEFVKQWRKGTTIEKSLTKTRHTWKTRKSLSQKKKQQKVGSFLSSVFVVLSLFSSSYFLITTTIQYYNEHVLLCEYPVNKSGWCD